MLAERMQTFSASPTSAVLAKVAALREAGRDIISLNVGEPDFGTPDYIKCAAVRAIMEDFTKYTAGEGIALLRRRIAEKLAAENGAPYAPEEICVTAGAKMAIFSAVMAIAGAGDEVVIPTPSWVSYSDIVKFAGARPISVPLSAETGYALDTEKIAAAVTERTRAVILCTPNNPTGAVYSEEALRRLAALAEERDFYIISDEIYEKLIYDGAKHFSVASVSPAVRARTITVNGFSKAYAMTGWRIGYAAANAEIIGAVKKIQSQTVSSVTSISQMAAAAALAGPQHDLAEMTAAFDARRRYMTERLSNMPGITVPVPKGAFYLLPDISAYLRRKWQGRTLETSAQFAEALLEAAGVAVVPGEAFGSSGTVRMSYSNSMEALGEAMDRLENFLGEIGE